MIPTANLRERGLDSGICLDQTGELLQTSAKLSALTVLRSILWIVRGLVDRLNQPHGFKGGFSGPPPLRVVRRGVHVLQNRDCVLVAHVELLGIADRDRLVVEIG